MSRSLLILFAALFASAAYAETTSWPGGIAKIDLGPATETAPTVEFDGKRVLVLNDNGRWQAVVGIPLSAAIGASTITTAGGDTISIDVAEHSYREQRLTVKQSYVTPNDEALQRITGERKIIDAALNNWRDISIEQIALGTPVEGPRSSSFGLRRFFNDEPRSPHSGMDIAANSGEAIVAPLEGVVTAIGDYYFNGNTVLLDHGQGFVTMYCHMSEIDVEEGQLVEAGIRLGAVGATGRVTGAHLHFGTYLNGAAVDPALLLISEQAQAE